VDDLCPVCDGDALGCPDGDFGDELEFEFADDAPLASA
jgi:hypothetical protein